MSFDDNKKFWIEFINLFKACPCLWHIKSEDHGKRSLKRAAYNILVQKAKEINPKADKEFVVKKLNTLRACFRRQLRKIEDAIASGSENIPKPTLWYYEHLKFTAIDNGRLVPSVTNLKVLKEIEADEEAQGEIDEDEMEIPYIRHDINEVDNETISRDTLGEENTEIPYVNNTITALDIIEIPSRNDLKVEDTEISNTITAFDIIGELVSSTIESKFKEEDIEIAYENNISAVSKGVVSSTSNLEVKDEEKIIEIVDPESSRSPSPEPIVRKTSKRKLTQEIKQEYDKKPNLSDLSRCSQDDNESDNEWDMYGKTIGVQLKGLDKYQAIIAQKLFSDVIFNAKMGHLRSDSFIQLAPFENSL